MAKNRFNIKPKLGGTGAKPKKLPIQKISVEQIEKIAKKKDPVSKVEKLKTNQQEPIQKTGSVKAAPKATSNKKTVTSSTKQKKRPQGRPKRIEAVKRLSSDLPAHLYDKVKEEVRMNGYSLNGFLAKVIREYFDKKEND